MIATVTPEAVAEPSVSRPPGNVQQVVQLSGDFQLCGTEVECMGLNLKPDETKGYCEFRLAYTLPAVTESGGAIHPGTLERSYLSLLHQQFNLGHLLRVYDENRKQPDRILGAVVAVEIGGDLRALRSSGGWSIPTSRQAAPHIRGVACVSKLAHGVADVIGDFSTGRRPWTVSMEIAYDLQGSAFGLKTSSGWVFIPWADADSKLIACYDRKRRAMVGKYKGVTPVLCWGGAPGQVHWQGVGWVNHGKEPTAVVDRILAGRIDGPATRKFATAFQQAARQFAAIPPHGPTVQPPFTTQTR